MALNSPKTIECMYKHMRHLETKYVVRENCLAGQIKINPQMRAVLIDWLVDVVKYFELLEETLQMAVGILDRYLQAVSPVESKDLQLIGITALLIASKYEEVCSMYISDLVFVTGYTYTKAQVIKYERKMLFALHFGLSRPIPLNFLIRFINVSDSSLKEQHLAEYFVNLSLVEYCMAHYKPSELAAAAVCLSLYLLSEQDGKTLATVWTPTLATQSRYELDHVKPIVHKIATIVTQVPTSDRKAVYKKFSRSSYNKVARLPELQGSCLQQLALLAQDEAFNIQAVDVDAPLQFELGPVQQEQGPVQQEQGPVQQEQGPVQQEQGPVQQEQGPVQQEQGPEEQGPSRNQRKRQACPGDRAPTPPIPATRPRMLQSWDGLHQLILVQPNDPAAPVTPMLVPVMVQYVLVQFPEQF